MILSKLKVYLLGFLTVLSAGLFGYAEYQKARREHEELKGEKEARKVERKATKAMVDGLKKEAEVSDEIPTDPDYDIFGDK